MPAVSKQQFKKMFVLYKQGKISKEELQEYVSGVDYEELPKKRKQNAAANLLKKKTAS